MNPLVSVVVVNYRAAADVARTVSALRLAEPSIDPETIVVDNSRDPGEAAALRAIERIALVVNPDNRGFAAACNQGARAARGEYLLLLNPDVRPRPGAVSLLLAAARRHPEAGVLAPRLLNPDGSPQHNARTFYRWRTVLARRGPLRRLRPDPDEERRHLLADGDPVATREVDWAIGACLLLRRADFLALGGMDERFFLYFEDVDLCLRAWRAGRSVLRVGAAEMVHAHRRASAGLRSLRAKGHHLSSMLAFHAKHRGWPRREEPAPGAPLVFVHEGQGALAERARRFACALGGGVVAKDAVRAGPAARALAAALRLLRLRPRHVHVIDVGASGVLVAAAARLVRARVVLDTGDEHWELMRRTDHRRGPGLALGGAVERLALELADVIVARGRGHVAALAARGYNHVRWIPDGADVARCVQAGRHSWRAERGWEGCLVAASVGSLLVDARYGLTQGWDLIEALALAPRVRAAVVGDGPGQALLVARARALGLLDRIAFLGRCPPAELPGLLKSFDVCLSTQTDDAVGRARTTGKLPLFLAAGRYVLASRVGEAARVLPAEMLVPYHGEHDPGYPARLAARLNELERDRSPLERGRDLVAIAAQVFDYPRLESQVRALLETTA